MVLFSDQFVYQKNKNNRLLLTHWLIKLINTPKCLDNRLKQFTETCWLNTILNSLLLVPELRECI